MPSIPGATNVLPGVFTDVVTTSRGVTIPGGSRIAAIIGEGSAEETIVSQALGGGVDGLNSSYTSTSGADGRHFRLSAYPLISNRINLYKNGVILQGLESVIDGSSFSNRYDYRIDISTGKIELQTAHLRDQGGAYYVPASTNVGDGYLASLSLIDSNAAPETWSIRCISVVRDSLNNPIQNTAKFIAFGSISGAKLDANGNPIIWTANGTVVSNGILSFAIYERKVGGVSVTPFREGDTYSIIVDSGVLVRNDTLTCSYVPSANLNDPVLLQNLEDVAIRHGSPSLDNNLSLGCQLAFANAAPAIMTVQAAPAMPRRTSYILEESVNAGSTNPDDFMFPLPAGVVPDANSNIHFFVTNNVTNVETQILPNKLDYYLLGTTGYPTVSQFVFDDVSAPAGYSYYYTVVQDYEAISYGSDGYIGRDTSVNNKGLFSSSQTFDSSYVGKVLNIINATNESNIGFYSISSVSNGKLVVQTLDNPSGTSYDPENYHTTAAPYFSDFINENPATFQVISKATGLALDGYSGTDGVLVIVGAGTAQATLDSATVDFNTVPNITTNYQIKLVSTEGNNGLYDIIAVASNQVTIKKTVVNESNMRYEVLDLTDSSSYIVVNHNVVPNGYRLRVSIIDNRDASYYDAGWVNALESLETVECDVVVPLPKQTISVIFQNTLAHCKAMSNIRNKKERVMFCGAISGLTPDNLTGAADAAVENIGVLEGIQGDNITEVLEGNIEDLADYSVTSAFGNTYRCVYFYPDQIVVQAGTESTFVDGFYIAAAAAGYVSADLRLENPLTNKVLSGFSILRNKQFSTLVLEQLAQSGVTTLQPVSGGGRIIWGITTTSSGFPEEQEISIVFIRDRVAKVLRAGFAPYIGQPESRDTESILTSKAVILLNSLVSQNLITDYANLTVKRDASDPRQWNIAVSVQPVYPVNWIYIKVNIGQL